MIPTIRHSPLAACSLALSLSALTLVASACREAPPAPTAAGTAPTGPVVAQPLYDGNFLHAIAYDLDKNGKLDHWTMMDGARPIRADIDKNENGHVERWEYYDKDGRVEKVGISNRDDGIVDAVVYQGADGEIARMDIASRVTGKVERWEKYEGGKIKSADEDLDGDGQVDKWTTFTDGHITASALDEDHDGKPDKRLSYNDSGNLISVETDADGKGGFRKKTAVTSSR